MSQVGVYFNFVATGLDDKRVDAWKIYGLFSISSQINIKTNGNVSRYFFSPSLSCSAFYIMKCFKVDNILAWEKWETIRKRTLMFDIWMCRLEISFGIWLVITAFNMLTWAIGCNKRTQPEHTHPNRFNGDEKNVVEKGIKRETTTDKNAMALKY